jgi:hypothetical protein
VIDVVKTAARAPKDVAIGVPITHGWQVVVISLGLPEICRETIHGVAREIAARCTNGSRRRVGEANWQARTVSCPGTYWIVPAAFIKKETSEALDLIM